MTRVFVALVFLILFVYSIPIYYEAILENRVLRAARYIAKDIRDVRAKTLTSKKNYGIIFYNSESTRYKIFADNNSNNVFDRNDKLIKEFILDDKFPGLSFVKVLEDKTVLPITTKTIIISTLDQDANYDKNDIYIDIINKRDLDKKIYTRISRIHWTANSKLTLLRYLGFDKEEGKVLFKEI